jgi:TRAP-type C4-dicarboxylate transport system permease large subunit
VSESEERESPARRLLSTVPILLLLLVVLLHGTGEKVHARLLEIGQRSWPGYAQLRVDPKAPTCDPKAVPAPAAKARAGGPASGPASGPAAAPAASAPASAAAKAAPKDAIDDLLGDDDPVSPEAARAAAEAARKRCVDEHAAYQASVKRLTGGLKTFRAVEKTIASGVDLAVTYLQHILVLMLLLAAITTTAIRNHIGLRNAHSRLDHQVSEGFQLVANLLLLASSIAQVKIDRASGAVIHNPALPMLWIAGSAFMAVFNLRNAIRPPADAAKEGKLGHALLCVPLYATMAIISGVYFLLKEGHPSGLAIYLQKLTEHALLYLQVGLYVWIGMMLKRTRIATLAFDVIRPWKLPPEVLAALVMVLAAFPTAYSGASGIFVMAAGAIIFVELRRAGARPQLAIATTSMSGALGVVIKPCLLVVIVASLNKEVTTDQIYGMGWKIFLITAAVLLVSSLILARKRLQFAAPGPASRESGRKLVALLPFLVVTGLVLVFYSYGLGTKVDEHTAPTVLPVLLLLLVWWDRRAVRTIAATEPEAAKVAGVAPTTGYGRVLMDATSETSGHIGALLIMMGCSVCLGGIVERGNLMALVPQSLGGAAPAMALLVVVMVLVGMTMDPYGAVILVSITLAPVAYRNGIDPLHFWLMVLAAFELGYVTPPVALNNLLTRRLVENEEPEALRPVPGASFYARNEGVILCCLILGVRLLLVAFLPFFFK